MFRSNANATEQLSHCLEAIERWNPVVNAMVTVDREGALSAAKRCDEAARTGRSLGLLHGVPIIIKDNIDTANLRTTYGSLFFKEHIPEIDAHVVRRLRAAGAVIVGKATMHEFAFGVRSDNPVIGQCRNPWDRLRIPGGSSGGSGVAIATGMATLALGTDTGGSVRIPAALNGITGLRPTFGRVSNSGTMPVSVTHDTVGPMARSAEEVALLFSVIAGYDKSDPLSANYPIDNFLPRLHDGVRGLRVGRPRNHYFNQVDDCVATSLEHGIETLSRLGAEIVDVDIPGAEEIHDWATKMIYSDACELHSERLTANADMWSAATLERLQMGLEFTGVNYSRAMRRREIWCSKLTELWDQVDMLVSPTCPSVAPHVLEDRNLFEATRSVSRNTYAGAFGRIPGISLPCGFSAEGLPIGMQLEASSWSESILLRAGCAFQKATDWHLRRPFFSA
ncbi:MAG: amidase [Burkholderiaceae bacterium]